MPTCFAPALISMSNPDPRTDTGASSRARAARIVRRVVAGRHLEDAMSEVDARDGPFVREICYGCARHYYSLDATVAAHLYKPLRAQDADIHCLLLVGAYQLIHMRVPKYAAVSETVAATANLRKPWAKALVNGILRKIAESGPAPGGGEDHDHPRWLVDALAAAYPERLNDLLVANNSRAPMGLRVNCAKTTPAEYAARIPDARSGMVEEALILATPMPISDLPRYTSGHVAVQDEGAQLAAHLLAPTLASRRARVLDACAAPGGKSFHLLERCPSVSLTALDTDAKRLDHMRAEAQRLGHVGLVTRQTDATRIDWWDRTPFDAILLDAPCSATGTIRRHPDIKLHRSAQQITAAATLQSRLLASLWRTLRPGGNLLYCTCSILPEENDDVVARFLSSTPDAEHLGIDLPWGTATAYGRQLLPAPGGADGFFYSRIAKSDPSKIISKLPEATA